MQNFFYKYKICRETKQNYPKLLYDHVDDEFFIT